MFTAKQGCQKNYLIKIFFILSLVLFAKNLFAVVLNNPYPKTDKKANVLYSSFAESPKTLDPARSYSSNEYLFLAQIYEPPLQYHYLKRPYELIPLTATEIPKAKYFSKRGKPLPDNAPSKAVAYTIYTITIKPGIYFQPHPAFAKDLKEKYYYHHIDETFLEKNAIMSLRDFFHTGTRELTAADYIYQIKRLADPQVQSPIFGLMSEHIVGLKKYAKTLQTAYKQQKKAKGDDFYFDLRQFPLSGVKQINRYTYQIKIKGKYPQFLYWLAMPFFSPMPWEVDLFDSQQGMQDLNLTINWYPIGTGPYMLTENNPNRRMVLEKNPYFHSEKYPTEGAPGDKAKGLLQDAGKLLPFINEIVFNLEKESIPRWSKFLQGYYDTSGISSDSFDQAIHVDQQGNADLTPELKNKGIKLYSFVSPSIFYMGFNMLDDVVGGYSARAQKLRQAIAIAVNYEEFISIFFNGRGLIAQGPIPPGIFGYQTGATGIDPYVYTWNNGKAKRKSIAEAKKLLAEAGYPGGIDKKTGEPLVLNYDVPASSGPDDKARFDWYRKQFAKLGIQLNIRATQYNRFQEKMRMGNAQIFSWGWHADYPDPENFLFLLVGANGKVKYHGENAANYSNPEFDRLFEIMKDLPNGPKRQAVINQMLKIVRRDAPWIWGFYPQNFTLSQVWNRVTKPNEIANNTLKYARLNPALRAEKRNEWNQAIFWPILVFLGLLVLSVIPVWVHYWKREHKPPKRIDI